MDDVHTDVRPLRYGIEEFTGRSFPDGAENGNLIGIVCCAFLGVVHECLAVHGHLARDAVDDGAVGDADEARRLEVLREACKPFPCGNLSPCDIGFTPELSRLHNGSYGDDDGNESHQPREAGVLEHIPILPEESRGRMLYLWMMSMRTRIGFGVLGILVIGGIAAVAHPALTYPFRYEGKAREDVHDDEHALVRIRYPEYGRAGVDAAITVFREGFLETAHDDSEDHAGGRDTFEVSYRTVWRSWRYVSVVYDVTVSSAGLESVDVPTVITYPVARTYDLYADRMLTVADLGPGDVAGIAVALIRGELRGVDGIDDARAARYLTPGSLTDFTLQGDDVVFSLSPGQVAAPERGAIEVRIPREAFR